MLKVCEDPLTLEVVVKRLQKIETLLLKLTNGQIPAAKINVWFTVDQLSDYLPDRPVKGTIYSMVSKKAIPYHKNRKQLLFLKSEIDAWLMEGQRKTNAQTDAEDRLKAIAYLRGSKSNK